LKEQAMALIPSNSKPGPGAYQANPVKQARLDFAALASAIQAGDLPGAQKAFAAFEASLQPPTGPTPAAQAAAPQPDGAITALGGALQTGDLRVARQAFSALVLHRRHHGHHAHPASPPPIAATAAVGANGSGASSLQSAGGVVDIRA
jgi:hypothetical protein